MKNKPSFPTMRLKTVWTFLFFAQAIFCGALACAQVTQRLSNANPNNYDNAKIMAAIRNPTQDLVVLAAHRGTHALGGTNQAPNVPENSLQSIGLAAQAGWEAVEIDVKLTNDGVPILSHDQTWGREWCANYTGAGPNDPPSEQGPFDPFKAPGTDLANDAKNAKVADVTLPNTKYWFTDKTELRDSVKFSCPIFFGEYPPTLSDVYNYLYANHIQMVLELDIKDAATAKAAWAVVKQKTDDRDRPASSFTIFKEPAINFPDTNTYLNTFGSNFSDVKFNPVFHTANVGQPQAGEPMWKRETSLRPLHNLSAAKMR